MPRPSRRATVRVRGAAAFAAAAPVLLALAVPASAATAVEVVRVARGTEAVRFAVVGRGLSLRVVRDGRPLPSGAGEPAGQVTVMDPAPGAYQVTVGFSPGADGTSGTTTGRLDTWVVPERGGSAVSLSTDAVGFAPGRRFRYSASWRGLDPDKRYLGVVAYGDSGRRTVVAVR